MNFDGLRVGHNGMHCVVFDPEWWEVHRWLGWWRDTVVRKRHHGFTTIYIDLGGGRSVDRIVRVLEVLPVPRRRIEDLFKCNSVRVEDAQSGGAKDGGRST